MAGRMHGLHDAVAALLVHTADSAILPYYQRLTAAQIDNKGLTPGGLTDMVTIADREAEAMLADGLAALLPEAAIVGEEAAHADPALMQRLGDDLCWIIDPVDGTNNFGAGKPPFGILIALAERGETLAGWIYDPLTHRLCHAHKGQGAWIDGEAVIARETGGARPVAAISTVFMDAAHRAEMQARLAGGDFDLVDIPRCAAEQYPRLVLGVNDLSLFERTLAWDHAAGVLFLNESGGHAARPDGRPYRVDSDEKGMLGASSKRMWDVGARLLFG